MPSNCIMINNVPFGAAAGQPTSFKGKHSGKTLSGINLDFLARGRNEVEDVEKLLAENTVQVDDPYVGRSYKASLRRISESYQEGRPEHYYTLQIRELDTWPEFDVLEIEEHRFPVLKYTETDEPDDIVGRHAVLKLSRDEFVALQRLFNVDPIKIRRIGIDQEPITVRYGGEMYWSQHEGTEGKYYKQIIRFFPPESPLSPLSKAHLASGIIQISLAKMVLALSARFEALLNDLTKNNIISTERRAELLGANWKSLLNKDRIEEIIWQLEEVRDAEEEL